VRKKNKGALLKKTQQGGPWEVSKQRQHVDKKVSFERKKRRGITGKRTTVWDGQVVPTKMSVTLEGENGGTPVNTRWGGNLGKKKKKKRSPTTRTWNRLLLVGTNPAGPG